MKRLQNAPIGGLIGNQNARRHGMYSRQHPPDADTITDMLRVAVKNSDPAGLRAIATIVRFHGDPVKARSIQQLARLVQQANDTRLMDQLADQVEERLIAAREEQEQQP